MPLKTPHFSICCKSPIVRTHFLQDSIWQTPNYASLLLRRRSAHLPVLLFSRNFHLHSHSLPLRHCFLLPNSPFSALFRYCTSSSAPAMSSLSNPSADSSPSPSMETKRIVIKGRVQGVFYRDWTVKNATELGLKGWVRNKRDCSVEALFSGPKQKVEEMIQRCRRGPPAASVTGLEAFPSSEDPGTGFERRHTA